MKPKQTLSPLTLHVIKEKGTEAPYTNSYWNLDKSGIDVDIKTNVLLFSSKDKFHTTCGWPIFSKPLANDLISLIRTIFPTNHIHE